MTEIKLSQRLQAIANFVPQNARLADIGSDHAFLPTYLVQQKKINYAVAGEVVQGPFEIAKRHVEEAGLHNEIYVRKANGLAAINEQDGIDTIVIAGMGGILITEILSKDRPLLKGVSRLILQPNNHDDTLRRWLLAHDFVISHESILLEAGKFYEIIVAVPKKQHPELLTELSVTEYLFGPILLTKKTAIFRQKWEKELRTLNKILAKLPQNQHQKREDLEEKKQRIEEVLSEN